MKHIKLFEDYQEEMPMGGGCPSCGCEECECTGEEERTVPHHFGEEEEEMYLGGEEEMNPEEEEDMYLGGEEEMNPEEGTQGTAKFSRIMSFHDMDMDMDEDETPEEEEMWDDFEDEEVHEKMSAKAKKSKLDPVGKEDKDINNDGKVNSSDEYLKKRREAIGKSINGKKSSKEDKKPAAKGKQAQAPKKEETAVKKK
jgi:hypothetical protein